MRNIINLFKKKKEDKEKISVITCYDFTFSKILCETSIDCLLVGDTLGMVIQGQTNTLPVTLDEMIYHAKAVRRGAPDKCIVCDMPFMSYQVSIEDGIRAVGRVMKETDCDAIKIEGGSEFITELTTNLVEIGIPVMGHLGLTPQSVHALGGHRLQGKETSAQEKMIRQAKSLREAGVFSMVLEMIPETLGKKITGEVEPCATIGIGAGREMDGQVLVLYDLLGLLGDFSPRFLKKYANLFKVVKDGVDSYSNEVKEKKFPGKENIF